VRYAFKGPRRPRYALDVRGEAYNAGERGSIVGVAPVHDEIQRRFGEEDDGEGKDEAPVNWYVTSVQP
jgi:hypothetical protein